MTNRVHISRLLPIVFVFLTATACSALSTCGKNRTTPATDAVASGKKDGADDLGAHQPSSDASSQSESAPDRAQRRHLRAAKRALMLQREATALRRFGDVLETGEWSDAQLQAVTHLVQLLIERDRAARALKLLDNQIPESARNLESLRILRARAESAAGNLDRAIELYTALLEQKPGRLVLYPRIAALYERTEQSEKAADIRGDLNSRIEKMAARLDSPQTAASDKVALLQTLSQVSTPAARKAATDALTASSPDVQTAAARALGDMGASKALPELRALKGRTTNAQVKSAVASALSQIESSQ